MIGMFLSPDAGDTNDTHINYCNLSAPIFYPYSLADNQIGDVGANAIGDALKTNTALQTLK